MAYKGNRINPRKFEKGQLKIVLAILPLVLFMGLPIIFIFSHAFKPMEELFAYPPVFSYQILLWITSVNCLKLLNGRYSHEPICF